MPNKNRQLGESISQGRNRLRNQNMLGVYGGELEPAVVTAEYNTKPTGNGFQRIRKFRYPYGKQSETFVNALNDHTSLGDEGDMKNEGLYDPSYMQNLIDGLNIIKSEPQAIAEFNRKTDDYRGNYASSLIPFVRNSSPNDFLSQLYRGYSRKRGYQSNQNPDNPLLTNKGTDIIDLDKNVIRLTPDSSQSTALFNEFVETRNPSVLPASVYQSGQVSTVSDRDIPVENINLFAGIENGHYKVDSLSNFNPNTVIYPARNIQKHVKPIKQFVISPDSFGPTHAVKSNIAGHIKGAMDPGYFVRDLENMSIYPESLMDDRKRYVQYRDSIITHVNDLLKSGNTVEATKLLDPDYYETNKKPLSFRFLGNVNNGYSGPRTNHAYFPKDLSEKSDSLYKQYQILEEIQKPELSKYGYVDTDNQYHPITDYNASILDSKMIFGNPNGGKFIGRVQDISKDQLNKLNEYLSLNPSGLVRPDLGSFSQYRLDNPSLSEYLKQYFEHPKADDPNVYTIGTTEPNKLG